jgi:hypothetical protein
VLLKGKAIKSLLCDDLDNKGKIEFSKAPHLSPCAPSISP